MLISFSTPQSRLASEHYSPVGDGQQVWHRYGGDLVRHFRCEEQGLIALTVEQVDRVTGTSGQIHCFFKSRDSSAAFHKHLVAWDPSAVVQYANGSATT